MPQQLTNKKSGKFYFEQDRDIFWTTLQPQVEGIHPSMILDNCNTFVTFHATSEGIHRVSQKMTFIVRLRPKNINTKLMAAGQNFPKNMTWERLIGSLSVIVRNE